MRDETDEILFERDFEAHDNDGHVEQVKLRVWKPRLKPETTSELKWYCPYQITGAGIEINHKMSGIDGLHALLNSLKVAHIRLKDNARDHNKKITWLGEEHLGLPENDVSGGEHKNYKGFAGFEETFEAFFRDYKKDKSIDS